jgi:hypothetical protein
VPLYRLTLVLEQGDGQTIESKPIVVANEFPSYALSFVPDTGLQNEKCIHNNLAKWRQFSSLSGIRSSGLAAFSQALARSAQLAKIHSSLCPAGSSTFLRDLHPVNILPGNGAMELALLIQCRSVGQRVTTMEIVSVNGNRILLSYRPRAEARFAIVSSVGRRIELSYLDRRGFLVGESVQLRDGQLTMTKRRIEGG